MKSQRSQMQFSYAKSKVIIQRRNMRLTNAGGALLISMIIATESAKVVIMTWIESVAALSNLKNYGRNMHTYST